MLDFTLLSIFQEKYDYMSDRHRTCRTSYFVKNDNSMSDEKNICRTLRPSWLKNILRLDYRKMII